MEKLLMRLGDILAEMILYGDIDEAPEAHDWSDADAFDLDKETYTRKCIAATLLKIMNGDPGGSCSQYDDVVRPLLLQEVDTNCRG